MEKVFHEVSFTDDNGRSIISRVPVVQELARQGIQDLPEKFIRLDQDVEVLPSFSSPNDEMLQSPPLINMDNLRDEAKLDEKAQELTRLAEGVKEWGMFFIKNHGIPSLVLDSLRKVVEGFFSLSLEEKKESVGTYMNVDNMGYGRSFVKSDNQRLDWIDRLSMRAAPKSDTAGLRVWPKKPVDFRQAMERYVEESKKVCDDLLQSLAEALLLEKESFLKNFEPERSVVNVRINYYPPCPRPQLALGISPHSDASVLTLLAQFACIEALEVLKDGQWIRIPAMPEVLLVNVGDLLEIMSNGRVKSPWHRVVTHKEKERISVALFYNPALDLEIDPIQGHDTDVSCYKKVIVKEYLQHHYKVSPCTQKQAIMFAQGP